MSEVLFELKFPEEYLEYDDIENLWAWGITNNKNLILNDSELNISSKNFSKMITEFIEKSMEKKQGSFFNWIKELMTTCDPYYVENIQHIDGGNFLLSHGILTIKLLDNGAEVQSFVKELDKLIDWSAEEILTKDLKISKSGIDSNEIKKIQSVVEKLFSEGSGSIWDLPNLFKQNGYTMKEMTSGGVLRFEIKLDDGFFTLCNENKAPEKFDFQVKYIVGFSGGGDW